MEKSAPKRLKPRRPLGVLAGVVLLLTVVALNTSISLRATARLIDRNNRVEHTRIVSDEIDAILAALLNAQTGERGYILTGDRRYLDPYELGKSEIESHLNRFARLTADNPVQQQNVERLRPFLNDALALFQQSITLEAEGQHRAATELILTGRSKDRMDAVRTILQEMKAEELGLLATRSSQAQQSATYLRLAIPISQGLTALLLVVAGLLVNRDIHKRIESARRLRGLAERERAAHLELRQTQDALVRSEKLAAVGRMAATVAHEINNPLEAVTNLVWIARNDRSASETVRKSLGIADEELRRVAHITKRTLGFYRDATAPSMVNLRQVMDNVLGLYASRLNAKQTSVRTEYEDCSVFGHAGELRQLFSNLYANAVDAVHAAGQITVKISRRGGKNSDLPGVRVTIADNGCGIPVEHQGSIFEPFFTTKGPMGTGLGLWVAKQIVEKHGGRMRMRSDVQPHRHYTVVSVFLPIGKPEEKETLAAAG